MLFNFKLKPIQEVAPFGHEGDYSLSWFGLTDSWYWLQCGKDDLFRYSDEVLTLWSAKGKAAEMPYVDYQAVRLWEDIQDILPDILEPVPDIILQKLQPSLKAEVWCQEVAGKLSSKNGATSEEMWELYDRAVGWLDQRKLDVGYLREAPRIWFWNDGTTLFIHWNNTGRQFEGKPAWASNSGTISMPISSFIDEVWSFDQRLISAMQQRVDEVLKHWPRPDVHIDKELLASEHQDRAQSMSRTFAQAKQKEPTPWNEILSAIETLENQGFPLPPT